ncbi:cell wall-binding repeat-containing protein [Microbacterium sp. W1N]|uniref:cell wall-binding repeat-containing protein n=1 Tax=Microbacterium festucae TaxID=2977531 RepID=UPI0021C18C69|nr:cell wall-binding repeat-containing protein [Microbacterium festucae]MCT9819044.1 cell wall-binding repeat-containing protein [Microbacterium festucae]
MSRRRLSLCALLIGACVALTTVAPPAFGAVATGSLSGRITNTAGEPLAGVEVSVAAVVDGQALRTTSDATGWYALTDIPAGQRHVLIDPHTTFDFPYLGEWGDGSRGPQQQSANVVEPGANTLDVVLESGGTIGGTVTGEGVPLDARAVVHPVSAQMPRVWTDVTIEDGVVRSVALAPGDYYLWVSSDGWETQDHNGRVMADMPAGEPLRVVEGEVTAVHVDLVRESSLSGRVLVRGADGAVRPCARADMGVEYVGPPVRYSGATTDGFGRYRTQWGPGELVISVSRCDRVPVVPEYYDGADGAYFREQATPIGIPRGEKVQAADIVVDEASFLRVNLQYRAEPGSAPTPLDAAAAHITILKRDDGTGAYSVPSWLRAGDRSAEWAGMSSVRQSPALTGGTYTILVDAEDLSIGSEFYQDARYFAQSQDVEVEAGQTLDLGTMTLEPRFFDVDRIAGVDRYETAAMLATASVDAGRSPLVYIASGQDFPDALAASPAVITGGGVMLLTSPTELPAVTRRALVDLDPERVVVLGGTPTITAAVRRAIAEAVPRAQVERIGGADRYETGRLIVRSAFDEASSAYVATGANFPDALAAGNAAGQRGIPLILVSGTSPLDAETRTLLTDLGVRDVIIAGGPTTVGTALENDLAALLGADNVTRLAGDDRYATAALINMDAFSRSEVSLLATGANFPDALAAASLAGVIGAPVVLTDPWCLSGSAASSLLSLRIAGVTLIGGPTTLSPDVEELATCY